MGADVDGEHVGAGHGHREHPGLGVHAAAQVIPGPTEGQVLLPTHVIVLERYYAKGRLVVTAIPLF